MCHGEVEWPEGDRYIGEWQGGRPDGKGSYFTVTGGVYVGAMKNGTFHGSGTVRYASGGTYTGEFKSNRANGWGTFTDIEMTTQPPETIWVRAHEYTGMVKNNVAHGEGVLTFIDGSIWVGEFNNDKWVAGTKYDSEGIPEDKP